ncbi:hypothetical protein HGA64_03155 [Candidatus Falkowbacteria bacterium]|nr:hypothetical protein [Candidatus Falkowbacteria bacterium]
MVTSYHVLPIVAVICLAYVVTRYLHISGKITLYMHRKIWNIVLAVSFLVSCLLGLVLAILIDQNVAVSWYGTILWLHVELGIVLAVVGAFHASWHVNYYQAVLKTKK